MHRKRANIFGITVFCAIFGALIHYGWFAWAAGFGLAGVIAEIRDLRDEVRDGR